MNTDGKIIKEIIEVANGLKEKGCDLSKIRFTRPEKTKTGD